MGKREGGEERLEKEQEMLVEGPRYMEKYSSCSNMYLKCLGEEDQSNRK